MKTILSNTSVNVLSILLCLCVAGCSPVKPVASGGIEGYAKWCLETGMVPVGIDEYIVHDYNLMTVRGLFIFDVEAESPADAAGIHEQDVLVQVGNGTITDKESFVQGFEQAYATSKYIPVVVQRGATLLKLTVRVR